MTSLEHLPVAIVGAGPVGLAAAAELLRRGLPVKVFEAGETIAANVRDWGHVRLFSPWRYNIAEAAAELLATHGWTTPDPDELPTGRDLHERYLTPLSQLPELAGAIETGIRVKSISRLGFDKVTTRGRETKPFVLSLVNSAGERRELARAVIDASGTWNSPNPLGADGNRAHGEEASSSLLAYGIPDILGRDRAQYLGRTTLVVGGGHSAANALLDLHRLNSPGGGARIVWAVRGTNLARVFGGGSADELPARGALGDGLRALVTQGDVELEVGFSAIEMRPAGAGVIVVGDSAKGTRQEIGPFDRVIVATGQRPDLSLTRELRVDLDPWLESTRALGPLIDPNVHSCGTVPPHGHRELAHPEPGFYTIGVKSYGRAPTFLMLTGYEQARSVAAALAGDMAEADRVRLVLPETGVCSAPTGIVAEQGCCGGPAPAAVDACCAADAVAKDAGSEGCGCRAAA